MHPLSIPNAQGMERGCIYSVRAVCPRTCCIKSRKHGKHTNLWIIQPIQADVLLNSFKLKRLCLCSWSAKLTVYQNGSKEGTVMTCLEGAVHRLQFYGQLLIFKKAYLLIPILVWKVSKYSDKVGKSATVFCCSCLSHLWTPTAVSHQQHRF